MRGGVPGVGDEQEDPLQEEHAQDVDDEVVFGNSVEFAGKPEIYLLFCLGVRVEGLRPPQSLPVEDLRKQHLQQVNYDNVLVHAPHTNSSR